MKKNTQDIFQNASIQVFPGLLDAILEINYFAGLVFYFPKKNSYGIKTDILI